MDDDDRRTRLAAVVFLYGQIENPFLDRALTIAQVVQYDDLSGMTLSSAANAHVPPVSQNAITDSAKQHTSRNLDPLVTTIDLFPPLPFRPIAEIDFDCRSTGMMILSSGNDFLDHTAIHVGKPKVANLKIDTSDVRGRVP